MKPKLTTKEEVKLLRGTCPDCGTSKFLEGPSGGASVNIMCANKQCRSEFNICPGMFAERIGSSDDIIQEIEKEITRAELIDLD